MGPRINRSAVRVSTVSDLSLQPNSNLQAFRGKASGRAMQCAAIGVAMVVLGAGSGAAIPGNVGTGCTSGAAGEARTVFSGSPTLALVAHEMANAEVENDAVPSLMSEVAIAEAGSSWSTIDAAATCLVEHFMGFQDQAAGAWECPAALASVVADHIHD